MILYHWTHRSNVRSILRTGLRIGYALGKKKVVWHCTASKIAWALAHVSARHGTDPAEMVLLRIYTPRPTVKRTGMRGVYYRNYDYSSANIKRIGTMAEIVRSQIHTPAPDA